MDTKIKITEITRGNYPSLLLQISKLPEKIYMAGTMPSNENKTLCTIGSRNNSNYGSDVCKKLISGLKGYPITIISGMAIGIDSIAHQTAIESGLATIAFPGSGLHINSLYPRSKRSLGINIVASGGALLSPFSPDQVATNWTFPVRNRLMAGMSQATLIIEARQGSGTLITADYATSFGRDVLAVPGSIFSVLSYGPHMLIRRGAIPITSSEDILESLGFRISRTDGMQSALPNFAEISLSDEEKNIVDCLRIEPKSQSKLIEKLSLSPSQLNINISELELRGIIHQQDGIWSLT